MELIFHKSEKYIEEDIFYYISDQRDKHSMIKPKKENLISMTVDSEVIKAPNKKEISNIFYPYKKNSIDKIYIGLSFPLFSNNWAASYLRYLLKIIKKDGSIILPVYPEEQAEEKGMWSRSFLENIFTSRTSWKGINNVWAENDGVMSMRIGKKFPEKLNSTLNYYLDELGDSVFRCQIENNDNNNNIKIIKSIWSTSKFSAIIEKIIQENCHVKNPIYCDIGDNPALPYEINVSKYIKLKETLCLTNNSELYNELNNYFAYRNIIPNKKFDKSNIEVLNDIKPNIISIIYNQNNLEILKKLTALNPSATYIFFGHLDLNDECYKNFVVKTYSTIVATNIDLGKTINHYSDIIEKEINEEISNNKDKLYVLIPK